MMNDTLNVMHSPSDGPAPRSWEKQPASNNPQCSNRSLGMVCDRVGEHDFVINGKLLRSISQTNAALMHTFFSVFFRSCITMWTLSDARTRAAAVA